LFLGVLCSGAMSSAVALILLFLGIVVFLLLLKKDWCLTLLKVLLLIVGFGISYKFFYGYDNGFYLKQIENTSLEMGETLKGNAEPLYGSGRIHIWKSTLDILPKNVLNGVGIDNFYYAFDGKPLTIYDGKICYDKVHNEYLQILVTQGIFALLTYLILYIIIVLNGIKNSYDKNELYLILPVGGYLVQAFFNISVIEVAPLFYICLGFLINRSNKVSNKIN
jgi:putative inorganic carbon (HCO3(-)) transporter